MWVVYMVVLLSVAIGMYYTGKWAGMTWTLTHFLELNREDQDGVSEQGR